MFASQIVRRRLSDVAKVTLLACIAMTVLLSVADGIMYASYMTASHSFGVMMLKTVITDFRYLFENGVYAATLLFVGARFLETRTLLTIGFDRLDSHRVAITGPDEANYVWVGRQYGSRSEGEAVVAALQSRLSDSAQPGV